MLLRLQLQLLQAQAQLVSAQAAGRAALRAWRQVKNYSIVELLYTSYTGMCMLAETRLLPGDVGLVFGAPDSPLV